MIDNKPSEFQAEDYIKYKLHQAGIKHSKPAFDQHGADLLIVDDISEKYTSILKVQCKYRKVTVGRPSNVTIPIEYVTEHFLLFLYITDDEFRDQLYVFFKENIEEWSSNGKEYALSLSANKMSKYAAHSFNQQMVNRIIGLLKKQPIKEYTSIIIDGIFLERAISATEKIYQEIYPNMVFKKPTLEEVVSQMLFCYNRYPEGKNNINCLVYDSIEHNLTSVITLPAKGNFLSQKQPKVEFSVRQTDEIVSFQILEQLKRLVNTENILLVANDVSYEKALIDLIKKNVDVILITLKDDQGGQIFTGARWGDIMYPLALALGVERSDL